MFNPKSELQKTIQYLPSQEKEKLAQFYSLTRQQQIDFRKQFILKYAFGPRMDSKLMYNVLIGGVTGLLTFSYMIGRDAKKRSTSDDFNEFQKKLAGAFLGGHIGQLAVALFDEASKGNGIRNESQDAFIIGTLIFAGGEGIELIEKALSSQEIFVPEVQKSFTTLNASSAIYSAYNVFNFASIAFQLYWQNAISVAFEEIYPLSPRVLPTPPLSGYRSR